MIPQCVVACLLVALGMMMGLGLVRIAANTVMLLLALGACYVAIFSILDGAWQGWLEIAARSLATGGIAALLCLPVLPFSGLNLRKQKHK